MIITHKEPDLYRAAVKGQIDVFMNNKGHFKCLVTPTKNTILHIYIKARSTEGTPISTRFVEEILHKCPPLFMQVNITEETPLHIAARYGHASIMKVLIKHAKSLQTEVCRDMMRMRNNKQDTALHDPLQFKHLGVAWMLAKEDDEVVYFVNDADETTVPIAVKGGEGISEDILHIIVENSSLDDFLMNKKHEDHGATPAATTINSHPRVDNMTSKDQNQHAIDVRKEQTHGEQCIQNACTSSNNNENRTGITDSEVDKANKDAILVVSALIATVTVAAAFTLPGGYLRCLHTPLLGTAIGRKEELLRLREGFSPNHFAMAAMVIAFVTGTYAVLGHSSALAILPFVSLACLSSLVL
ncbi:hypothetical protein FNV43_RR00726 [Rhamnella rubrinervis]|uniref:PGG domain-containing protein n=1 Tax=Rhamnella rubrinervis TaxID=2594499 RepID=A0A8K0MSA4_9ROSA|nr:hypothetical protein FNV43_RR00726 [Rhamnella rubrinervis]